MAKFFHCLLVLAVAVAAVSAEPPRFRTSRRNGAIRTNIRFLARQEAEAPTPTSAPAPYPPAGVTPEVPFELPTETEAPVEPDQTYGPPDPTYGPPPAEDPEATYGPPPAEEPEATYGPPPAEEDPETTYLPPDNTYGPPDAPEEEAEVPVEGGDLAPQNLIQPRGRLSGRLRSRASPRRLQRLRKAPLRVAPAPRPVTLVEIIRTEPVLVYTLQ